MFAKTSLTFLLTLISLVLFAQGKLYIIPRIGFYCGSWSGSDSVNKKQDLIRSAPFLRKDFIAGVYLLYVKKNWSVSAGIEEGNYSSGFKHTERRSNPLRVDSKETISQGSLAVLFTEMKMEIADVNIKKPVWLFRSSQKEKPYLLVSTLAPLIGFEYRRLSRTFINDFHESSEIMTSAGTIPGESWYHSYHRVHTSFRAGIDWTFYDFNKRTFILNFIYSFAFKDAGYFRYYFYKPGVADFYFQNTTRGNGFSIKAGIPIKIFEVKKK